MQVFNFSFESSKNKTKTNKETNKLYKEFVLIFNHNIVLDIFLNIS